jgi:hypothetical protein
MDRPRWFGAQLRRKFHGRRCNALGKFSSQSPCGISEIPRAIIGEGLPDFGGGVHHKRAAKNDALSQWCASEEQDTG